MVRYQQMKLALRQLRLTFFGLVVMSRHELSSHVYSWPLTSEHWTAQSHVRVKTVPFDTRMIPSDIVWPHASFIEQQFNKHKPRNRTRKSSED